MADSYNACPRPRSVATEPFVLPKSILRSR